jgi:hypothetical protein
MMGSCASSMPYLFMAKWAIHGTGDSIG